MVESLMSLQLNSWPEHKRQTSTSIAKHYYFHFFSLHINRVCFLLRILSSEYFTSATNKMSVFFSFFTPSERWLRCRCFESNSRSIFIFHREIELDFFPLTEIAVVSDLPYASLRRAETSCCDPHTRAQSFGIPIFSLSISLPLISRETLYVYHSFCSIPHVDRPFLKHKMMKSNFD